MPPKNNTRNWNDVQTAIATVSIVTTLGLWNLFATPSKVEAAQTNEPVVPPTEPPVAVMQNPTAMPQVKIMFTPVVPQNTVIQQTQEKKKKNKNNNDGGGGGGGTTVTQTQSS